MSVIRNGHVLKLEDGSYYIEEAPFKTSKMEDAQLYFKYFDLMEAQARAKMNTNMESSMQRVSFTITILPESDF
ncbi:hypothetical protein [Paenibacillus ginsengarvi]|uniref:Uncharacterized protein n=1 Tax=Paenibacillus ginsengarvi TaxID=400777 RepID=A0A3B0CFU6_9BACL|nr:hypothetical protein [Paenibacillus ginsengarvi]RKN84463.1 hypothetical protein D7M11_13355 [Paenibacillus ginsengarvi]